MLDDRAPRAGLILDNYADLLALAGVNRMTAHCACCPPDQDDVPASALYLLHDRSGDTEDVGLVCAKHAGEWSS